MDLQKLIEAIKAVVSYNWPSEYADALENGPEGHVIEHLIVLSEAVGEPISEEERQQLYADHEEVPTR